MSDELVVFNTMQVVHESLHSILADHLVGFKETLWTASELNFDVVKR